MEKLAFINGGTFVYWSSILLILAAVAATACFAALYLSRGGRGIALCLAVPMAAAASVYLGRLVHWYCRTDAYESFEAAMTELATGGYALIGVFAGCLLTAGLLRLLRIEKNLPRMLDCMALGGGTGIALGRLASLFNVSDRGPLMPESWGMPFASQVTNAVTGLTENRLATFMLQAILTGVIVLAILLYIACTSGKKMPDGDAAMLFLAPYCAFQILLDSTRYDSLFLRSNGFVSVVQILCLVVLVLVIGIYSFRMVRLRGLKALHIVLWVLVLACLGTVGYMEYYVQRHGDQALFAYSIMSAGLILTVALTLVIRWLGRRRT